MHRLVIIKTGYTLPPIRQAHEDFENWFRSRLGDGADVVVCNVFDGEDPGAPDQWDGVLVTGSPSMVTDAEAWSESTAGWLKQVVDHGKPVLGICYGHQLLAHALGGLVGNHPEGREIGTRQIELTPAAADDPLLRGLPQTFPGQLTHSQSVLQLPEGAVHLGHSDMEPNQAFRWGDRAWGLQFHPEFSDAVMHAYIDALHEELESENLSPQALHDAVTDAPEARSVLQRFTRIVTGEAA